MKNTDVDIVSIGHIIKETILYPDTVVGPVLGSPCAYTSLALARLGKRVGMVTFCADDWRVTIRKDLQRVDTTGFLEYFLTTESHLICDYGKANRVEYFKKAPVICPDVLPEKYKSASTFFICPMDYDVSLDICKRLHEASKQVVTDLGGFGGTTSYSHFSIGTKRGKMLIDDLCRYSDIIKASKDDLSYIMPGMSMEECTEYLISRGPQYAVVTMGADGVAYREAGKPFHICKSYPLPPDTKLNSIGAGDAFIAGMIASLKDRPGDIDYAMAYGNCLASLMMEKEGGCVEQRMPTYDMVKRRTEGK